MSTDDAVPTQLAPSDSTLIAAARKGETAAFQTLVARHLDAGMRLSRRLAPGGPKALLTEAVSAVTVELRSGAGPSVAFRPYLLAAVCAAAAARAKDPVPAQESIDALLAEASIDAELPAKAAAAYEALTEEQKVALWHTEVDGESLLDTGVLLGSPGTQVAELAFAARAALRTAVLGEQLKQVKGGACRWTSDRLGAHVRGRLTEAMDAKVVAHLEQCESCPAMVPGVRVVELELPVLVAVVVLGAAAGSYLGRVPEVVEPAEPAKVVAVAEIPGPRRSAAVAGLVRGPEYLLAHGKVATYMGIGTAVIAAGLIGGLHFVESGHSPASAADGASSPPAPSQPNTGDAAVAGVDAANAAANAAATPAGSALGSTVLGGGARHDSSNASTTLKTIGTGPAEARKGPVPHPLLSSPVQSHPAAKPVHGAAAKGAAMPHEEYRSPALPPRGPQLEPQAEHRAQPQVERKTEPQARPRHASHSVPKAQPQDDPQGDSWAEPQGDSWAEPQGDTGADPQGDSWADPQGDPQAKAQSHGPARPQEPAKRRAPAQPAGKVHLGLADLTFADSGGLLGTGLTIDPPTTG